MERVNKIIHLAQYNFYVNKIADFEKNRIFCKHDLVHFFDVARIAYIINLEESLGISKSLIYATGLLHDIGRYLEYSEGMPHDEAGIVLARPILEEANYHTAEIEQILFAIGEHRKSSTDKGENKLAEVIYRGDKLSRLCLFCPAKNECNWSEEKKNNNFYY